MGANPAWITDQQFRFMDFPPEIRTIIYGHLFENAVLVSGDATDESGLFLNIPFFPRGSRLYIDKDNVYGSGHMPGLLTASKTIRDEVTPTIRTPENVPADWSIRPSLSPGSMQIYVKIFTGKTILVKTEASERCLIFHGQQLVDGHKLSHYSIDKESLVILVMRLRGGGYGVPPRQMAIAAGGKIAQTIVRDNSEASNWRDQAPITFNAQLLDAACFRDVTGQEPPPTPISALTYHVYGFSFFKMYEEPSKIHGDFSSIKSVAQLEGQEEKRLDFPVKVISNSVKPDKRPEDSFLNSKGAFMPTFRHITELEESVKALNLYLKRKGTDGEEEVDMKVKHEV